MAIYASDIVTQACQIAKCPAFTTQAQVRLNALLQTLAQTYDFPSAAYTFNNFAISANGGNGTGTATSPGTSWYTLALPTSSNLYRTGARYLRTHSMFYSVNGTIFYLSQLPLDDYDKLFQGPGISNYPEWYCVDTTGDPQFNTPQVAFWPPPNIPLTLTIRNQYQPNDIATANFSTTVVWFPNTDLLIDMLAEKMMMYSGDKRQQEFYNRIYGVPNGDPGTLSRYLKMQDDKEGYAMTIKLDRRRFRSVNGLPPTKQTGF